MMVMPDAEARRRMRVWDASVFGYECVFRCEHICCERVLDNCVKMIVMPDAEARRSMCVGCECVWMSAYLLYV